MPFLDAPDYWAARWLLQRTLGGVYLVAFLVAVNQFRPLCGVNGILPVGWILERSSFRQLPSLFRLRPTDRVFGTAAWVGVGLSLLAVTGIADGYGYALSIAVWFLLWVLYLSFVNLGGLFYGYGWESLLLETGFVAIFLGPTAGVPNLVTILGMRWILFRVMFGAGMIKMRGDRCWRELTCLEYHYETQPLPNPWSFFLHRSPKWFHKLEVAGTHFVQLVAIWGVFLPQPGAAIAGILVIGFQWTLILSGNLSWLNYLTLLLAFACLHDGALGFLGLSRPEALAARPFAFDLGLAAVAILILGLSMRPARNLFSRRQLMNASFDPLHLVNTYGAFGSVTRERREIEIEGTLDERPGDHAEWRAYRFKGKPGNPRQGPRFVAPYHLRLDWQMWFAAMTPADRQPWFRLFVRKLLEADPAVLALLAREPFGGERPRWVRATWYRYRFSTFGEWQRTGEWWQRDIVGSYLPPVKLGE